MIELRETHRDELAIFSGMESDPEAERFIGSDTLEQHRARFDLPESRYLTIVSEERVVGFILLLLDPDGASVDFKRIVVAERGSGIGTGAIAALEEYCKTALGRARIWLNVFEENSRGRHIYEKLGYREFRSEDRAGRRLHYYQKKLIGSEEP